MLRQKGQEEKFIQPFGRKPEGKRPPQDLSSNRIILQWLVSIQLCGCRMGSCNSAKGEVVEPCEHSDFHKRQEIS